jgi:hypothetical protein
VWNSLFSYSFCPFEENDQVNGSSNTVYGGDSSRNSCSNSSSYCFRSSFFWSNLGIVYASPNWEKCCHQPRFLCTSAFCSVLVGFSSNSKHRWTSTSRFIVCSRANRTNCRNYCTLVVAGHDRKHFHINTPHSRNQCNAPSKTKHKVRVEYR